MMLLDVTVEAVASVYFLLWQCDWRKTYNFIQYTCISDGVGIIHGNR